MALVRQAGPRSSAWRFSQYTALPIMGLNVTPSSNGRSQSINSHQVSSEGGASRAKLGAAAGAVGRNVDKESGGDVAADGLPVIKPVEVVPVHAGDAVTLHHYRHEVAYVLVKGQPPRPVFNGPDDLITVQAGRPREPVSLVDMWLAFVIPHGRRGEAPPRCSKLVSTISTNADEESVRQCREVSSLLCCDEVFNVDHDWVFRQDISCKACSILAGRD